MSIVVEFFAAPDDDAAEAVVHQGPQAHFPTLSGYGNFLAFQALLEWENLLTGREFADLVQTGEPRRAAGHDGGAAIYAFSPDLQNSLAGAKRAELVTVAARWCHDDESIGALLAPELARSLLEDVAEFARAARDRNHALYCRMA